MHYLSAAEYTHLSGEINSLYHEIAVRMGLSDSVLNILYVICEKGDKCLQSEISKLTGISRQTINSAIQNLKKKRNRVPGTRTWTKYHCLFNRKGTKNFRRKDSSHI